jgi:hypothetical protein
MAVSFSRIGRALSCLLLVLGSRATEVFGLPVEVKRSAPHAKTAVALGGAKHVFIDDVLIDAASGAVITVNPPEIKELAIIADRPWERHGLPASGTVVHDPPWAGFGAPSSAAMASPPSILRTRAAR